ncbi:MAG: Na/Pi cotransporter family protein [Lachnospiraceae bacterium]|nr:Na/Pi cotransporter family protein [Lachnospiraceae bacterium]
MGDCLKKAAGNKLEAILEKMTTSKKKGVGNIKGLFLGTFVTGVIQSSAATTLMLIGFVNAGIMTSLQSIPVVFGANIGSTVTAQILRLGDLGQGALILSVLKPRYLAALLLIVGVFIYTRIKKDSVKNIAGIFIGLGTLFYGMTFMEDVFHPLRDNPDFQALFTSFKNPLVGIFIGFAVTMVIQSSSASVGILQALSKTGVITCSVAVPIIIGQNLGKCIAVVLGGIGANKNAKKVMWSYLLFNIFGALIISAVLYALVYTIGIPGFESTANMGIIANIHLSFNLISAIILMPFCKQIDFLCDKLTRNNAEGSDSDSSPLDTLDDHLLTTPATAFAQAKRVYQQMYDAAIECLNIANENIFEYNVDSQEKLVKLEDFTDKCETDLTDYLLKIDRTKLDEQDKVLLISLLKSVEDVERLGDYALDIYYELASYPYMSDINKNTFKQIIKILNYSNNSLMESYNNIETNVEKCTYAAERVSIAGSIFRKQKGGLKDSRIDLIENKTVEVTEGMTFSNLLNYYEGIFAHFYNLSCYYSRSALLDSSGADGVHDRLKFYDDEERVALENYIEYLYQNPEAESA